MNPNRQREEAIFEAALELSSPADQAAYLTMACGNDAALRNRIAEMLKVEGSAKEFFKRKAAAPGPRSASIAGAFGISPSGGAVDEPAQAGPRNDSTGIVRDTEGEGTTIGRYTLLQRIGEGGMGVVYMAEQEEPVRRRVALKIIKLGMDTKNVIARFEAERQALAIMDHPNIARVLDGGATETGRPYFAMELVQGVPITEFCDQNKLPAKGRLKLFIPVCQAIQSAHQKGIIHRDIKPSNVLVTLHHGEPMAKVIDFGIVKATNQKLTEKTLFTQYAMMIGTPSYMSPEQAEMSSLDVDTRTDVYALGVLLYELLTGTTPFPEKRLRSLCYGEMQRVIMEEEPERPSTRLSTMANEQKTAVARNHGEEFAALSKLLKGDLDWIVMKCLEKDRTRRYDTANGLTMDIQRHLRNEPIVARPPSMAYRFQKLVRRNKLTFAAGIAVAAALVVGLGTATVMFFRERLARQAEQAQRVEAQSARKSANAEAQKASKSQQQSRRLLYAADMNLAQQSLKLNNLGRARRLLDRHRPQPGEEDLRGWEWRYLWQLTRSGALVTLTNRPARGMSVSFSSDGTRLAVGWDGGRVDLWDVPGRRWIRSLTDGDYSLHQARVAFSPVRNLLATTSEPTVVSLYDLDAGRESILWRAPDQSPWRVRDLSFSPDGSRLVIYAGTREPKPGDGVWVVNVSTARIESQHWTGCAGTVFHGSARLSPDNRRLYLPRFDELNQRHSIRGVDLAMGEEFWQTEPLRDGLTALAISPDGQVLASGSGFEDSVVRIWDAATGKLLARLNGHTSWVARLEFSKDGRRLFSGAADQSICVWDTRHWMEMEAQVLRGHTDEVHAIAISDAAGLIASASKDGDLKLWPMDATSAPDGYRRLPDYLNGDQILCLDASRLLMLPPGKPPELLDLTHDSTPVSVPALGASTNVLGCFGPNILCHWNGTSQILVRELCGTEFVQRGAITVDSGARPTGVAYCAAQNLLAWAEGSSSTSVYLANLSASGHRIELKSDIPGLTPFHFSEDGNYLLAGSQERNISGIRRVWNVGTTEVVASIAENSFNASALAVGGQVLCAAVEQGNDHEIRFLDLANPGRPYRHVAGRYICGSVAASPDGKLVAASSHGGEVRLFDPVSGTQIDILHGHMNAAHTVAFSPDGRRLISTSGGREVVKLWEVDTRQELLTLTGTASTLGLWSADGNMILAGTPWQVWRAPSWEDIAAVEAKEKTEITP